MTFDEIKAEIQAVVNNCDESHEQQVVKAMLLSVLGAMHSRRHKALMTHICDFTARELIGLRAMGN